MGLIAYAVVTLVIVIGVVSGNNPGTPSNPPTTPTLVGDCATKAAHEGLAQSSVPELKKLAEYESACQGSFTQQQMLFASMPQTMSEATDAAQDMTATLKSLHSQSVSPLVIFEPADLRPQGGSLKDYYQGKYDAPLKAYFQTLQKQGITDEMMGTWVPFPEANTPAWGTTDASDFAANIQKVVGLQKLYFPDSKASILLNDQTYPDNDANWEHGTYASLVPYVEHIPAGLLDSFGYQGFPWMPEANDTTAPSVLKASEFLRTDLATEAAKKLGTKKVWLNTGTFNTAHTQSPDTKVTMSVERRKQILKEILDQVKAFQKEDFEVTVSLFSQDKSTMDEGVDWSYWQQGKPQSGQATTVFKEFARDVLKSNAHLLVYDATSEN